MADSNNGVLINGTSMFNGTINVNGDLLPHTNRIKNLGSSDKKWNNVYANTFTGNLTGNVTGNCSGSSTKVLDSGNSTNTTFAYSKTGLNYGDYTYLAGWKGYELIAVDKNQFVPSTGGTLTGGLNNSYACGSWVNSLTSSAFRVTNTSFGGWICGKSKNGNFAIASYPGGDDKLHFGYGESGRTTNSYAQEMSWDGPTGHLTTNSIQLLSTTDAQLSGNSQTGICIGSKSGQHMIFDTNEIMAKANSTSTAHLFLNTEGGRVYNIGIQMPVFQCGYVTYSDLAESTTTYYEKAITFPQAFPSVPYVMVTIHSNTTWSEVYIDTTVTIHNVTKTGFVMRLHTTSCISPNIDWVAFM